MKKPQVAIVSAADPNVYGGQERYCILLANGLSDYYEFTIICEGGVLAEQAQKNNIRTLTVPLRSNPLRALRAFLDVLHKYDFQILHSMESRGNLLTRLTSRQYSQAIRISTRHELFDCTCFGNYYRLKRKLIALVDRLSAKCSDRIIVVCEAIRREMIEQGYRDHQIDVVYNGIPDSLFYRYKENENRVARSENQIVAVGRLSREKGYEDLLGAVKVVSDSVPSVRLKLAGSGPLEPVLRNRIQRLNLTAHVQLLGYVGDVTSLLLESAVLAVPSLHEAFSLVVLEGMAAGLPIIGSRVGGIPEAVFEGCNGILVKPSDTRGLANALLDLLNNKSKREHLGQNSRKLVEGKFLFSTTLDKTRTIYDEELAGRARSI